MSDEVSQSGKSASIELAASDTVNAMPEQRANENEVSEGSLSIGTETPIVDGAHTDIKALANAEITQTSSSLVEQMHLSQLQAWLEIGGPVVWLLAVLSVIALSIIVAKVIQFIWIQPESKRRFERALLQIDAGELGTAKQILGERHPLSNMMVFSLDQHPHLGGALLKEDISRRAMTYIEQLKSGLRPLEMIGVVSPLFGLLGTVLGMIEAFQQMQQAGSQVDPSVLSGGIWKALLTTAVGLCVALPAVMAHAWIDRKVERVGMMTNDYLTRLFVLLESRTTKTEPVCVS